MQVINRIRDEYERFLLNNGEEKFYQFLLKSGSLARAHYEYPELMLNDQSVSFFSLYRTTGNKNYFTIGKILRRAANKIYRENKKKGTSPFNSKFLNLV